MRFSVCTLNLWADFHWERRKPAVEAFLRTYEPDILAVQELRPTSLAALSACLPKHDHVDDPFAGWQNEGNIFWRRECFECLSWQAIDVGISEPLRRLFVVRLREHSSGQILWVATAHFTWRETEAEAAGHANPRLAQARRSAEALREAIGEGECCLLLGDFNDAMHALRVLADAGFQETFSVLGREPVPTWPVRAIEEGIPELDDWIYFRGPLRPMLIDVPDFFYQGTPPSDHRAVIAGFRLAL